MIIEENKIADFTGANFGMVDVHGKAIHEGDVVLWRSEGESVVCQVKWNPYSFAFNLIELNGNDPLCEQTPIRRQGEYVRLGSGVEEPDIVTKWRRLKNRNFSFLHQGESGICFPLAAINACVGVGIEKTFLNFKLLNRMIEAGECRGWGGCIHERGALNEIQKEVNVEFVMADMDDVIENGGILTLMDGGFHACAVFLIDGDPYLVNSNIGEGEFVRPLTDISEIPRSEDPDHHRDYVLIRG